MSQHCGFYVTFLVFFVQKNRFDKIISDFSYVQKKQYVLKFIIYKRL